MFDPTQTQPLSWRMHDGKPTPADEVPDTSHRQEPTFDSGPPDLSERGYHLRGRLGSGRLGPIYEAQDDLSRNAGSQHFAAVLLIDERISSRPGFPDDFERGAAELKGLSHPNIVKLLEYGRDRNRFYLVNELVESASLRFVLNDVSALPVEETTAVLRAVGDALQYLHAKGIVHGNLKPESVLVTFGYDVKLLDIVPGGWLSNPNDALGVPARAPDKRDDVFGIACLAYEMLTGRHPYNGNTAQEAYRAGLEPDRVEDLTDRQWRALSNALAVHRDDRTPNVAQFLDDFGAAGITKLRAVVNAGGEARQAPTIPSAASIPLPPQPSPGYSPPVFAERAVPDEPERRGIAGKLFLLLLVIGAGVAAWYYQDPLLQFTTDLMTEVETRIQQETATSSTAAGPKAEAPLTQAPAVTEDAPATVLAPGAKAPSPAPAESVSAQPQATAPEASIAASPTPPAESKAPARAPAPRMTPPPPAVKTQPAPAPARPEPQVAKAEPEPAQQPIAEAPPRAAETAPAMNGETTFSFQIPATTVREGDVAARIVIQRSGDLSGSAEVSWWTADGTAVADRDYADLGARVERFAPGEKSRIVYVPLTNDAVAEPARSFKVMLGRGDAARTGSVAGEMRVDIIDDD
jgi:serine/threonine protein kinase